MLVGMGINVTVKEKPMRKRQFTVTDQHLKLLRRAVVSWEDCEFGAPSIDCKRPYGNSSVYQDIAEILDITPIPDDPDGSDFTSEQFELMDRLHKETQTVLQILLATAEIPPSTYEADWYDTNWQLMEQTNGN